MARRSRIDVFLSRANNADILLFVRSNPGCMRSDIYRSVSRNAHTSEKIDWMVENGLIDSDRVDGRTVLCLTEKGAELAELLYRAELVLGGPEDTDPPEGDGSS